MWWTKLQLLETDTTACSCLPLLPSMVSASLYRRDKRKDRPWLRGQSSQPLTVTAAVAEVRYSRVRWGLGLTRVLLPLLPTTLCDEHHKDKQTTVASTETGRLSSSSCNPSKAKSWSTGVTQLMHLQPQRWGNRADTVVHKAALDSWTWPHINAMFSLVCSRPTCL